MKIFRNGRAYIIFLFGSVEDVPLYSWAFVFHVIIKFKLWVTKSSKPYLTKILDSYRTRFAGGYICSLWGRALRDLAARLPPVVLVLVNVIYI